MLLHLFHGHLLEENLSRRHSQGHCDADPGVHAHHDEHDDDLEQVADAEADGPLQLVLVEELRLVEGICDSESGEDEGDDEADDEPACRFGSPAE